MQLTHDDSPRAVLLRVVRGQSIDNDANHTDDSRQDQRDQRVLGKVSTAAAFGEPEVSLVAQPSGPEHRD